MLKNKLLLVSPIPPPVGGIASWTRNILEYDEFNSNDWQIIHQNTAIKNLRITNKSFWQRINSGVLNSLQIIKEFKSNIKTSTPAVIHLTTSASFALLKDLFLIRIANKNKIPIVVHFHFGRIPGLAIKKNWEWKLLSKVIEKSNQIIVIDNKSYTSLIEAGFKNVMNIPNPVSLDLELKAKIEKTNKDKQKTISVLFVGHVIPKKGVFELVESCKSIPEISELILIGPFENNIKNNLIEQTSNIKDKNWLKILGTQESQLILEYMSNVTLLALPSYTEGFPNVIIEAMAMSCPVVATDVGAIPEMLGLGTENECGICVKFKDVEALRNGLLEIIVNKDKAMQFGKNGNEKVLKEYTLNNINKKYESVWQNALKNDF